MNKSDTTIEPCCYYTCGSIFVAVFFVPYLGLTRPEDTSVHTASTTPWGHPNFQGGWDRRTITPLERLELLTGKYFLTAEEIIAYEKANTARPDGRPLDTRRPGI